MRYFRWQQEGETNCGMFLRPKEGVSSTYLTAGIGYTPSLMEYIVSEAHGSKIARGSKKLR